MADEGEFPKADGDYIYGTEVNNMIKSLGANVRHSIWTDYDDNISIFDYNDNDGLIYEIFHSDVAETTTNLTHLSAINEYYSVTDGAYLLQTKTYLTDSNATAGICGYDYEVYKEITETNLESYTTGNVPADIDLSSDLAGYKQVNIKYKLQTYGYSGSSSYSTSRIYLTDDNGHSQLVDEIAENRGTYTNRGSVKIYFDITNNIIYWDLLRLIFDGTVSRTRSSVDISAWDATIYLQTSADTGEDTNTSRSTIYYQRSYKPVPTTTAVVSISSDDGTTWDIVPNNGYTKFTAGGTEITTKIAGTIAADEGIMIKKYYIKPTE